MRPRSLIHFAHHGWAGGGGELHRTVESFFQGNRFLLSKLVTSVMDRVLPEGEVLDLYAGVGLFAAVAVSLRTTGSDGRRGARPKWS